MSGRAKRGANAPLSEKQSMSVAYLEKRDVSRNMQRYYRVSVAPTLFGEFAVVREWGRIGQRGGSRMECWFNEESAAIAAGQYMAAAKLRRGYHALPVQLSSCQSVM